GFSADAIHAYLEDRQHIRPQRMSTLSRHDTKRSEDVRARLNVLSEIAPACRAHVTRCREMNDEHRAFRVGRAEPDHNQEYGVYQTLVGAWPLEPHPPNDLKLFQERVQAYALKAMREAKLHTTWTDPDAAYEKAVESFIASLFDEKKSAAFQADFLPFQRKIAAMGMLNSLSQTLLKLTAPGVPDTYQGTELWDFSLVDPDNRRPVNYELRRELLEEINAVAERPDRTAAVREMADHLRDGRAKMLVHRQALHARRAHPGLFTEGDYLPLVVTG